jgi:carbamate kinase
LPACGERREGGSSPRRQCATAPGAADDLENQRENVRVACDHLAPIAEQHELIISHGNGPQIGLLALEEAAYEEVPESPLDVLGAETQEMIGYLIEQELGNRLPFEKPLASLLTMIEVDPDDPAFTDPSRPIGPLHGKPEADKLAAERGWTFKPDGDRMRRVVARRCQDGSSSTGPSGGCSSGAAS